tara:strand:+ start:7783 stop:8850 length:1068 start_codon:yes stop_codon:yes gene_type:complete
MYRLREYIFIFLTATVFLLNTFSKSFSEENVFIIDDIEVYGTIDINFSQDKYIDEALKKSYEILISRILLLRDVNKVKNIKIKDLKNLVRSFKVLETKYRKNEYTASFRIYYDEIKVKKFLREKNISFFQPRKISVILFPIFFIKNEIKSLDENYFYKNWENVKIENEIINFILPLENLDDFSKIIEAKDKIEELNPEELVNKYDVENYAMLLMDYNNEILNIHIKTDFEKNKMSKNLSYNIKNIKDKSELDKILKDMKKQITDIWKEANLVNLLMPLSIKVKFSHKNIFELNQIKKDLYKLSIIDDYSLDQFDINNSFFKLHYYGNPKKLRSELKKFGYKLINDQGYWEIYLNE